jgi:hypothetical protein
MITGKNACRRFIQGGRACFFAILPNHVCIQTFKKVPILCAGLVAMMQLATAQESADLRINELLASNISVFPDNHDFDDYSDWIELYNPGNEAIELRGYFLSDNPEAPVKWSFPEEAVIAAKSYLVVRADGFDAVPGDVSVREYSPWDDFTVKHLHANFKLSAEGESVGLYRVSGGVSDSTLIPLDAIWSYHDLGQNLGVSWIEEGWDDRDWRSGEAPLGYGHNDEATVVDYGVSSRNKIPTYYFRHFFDVRGVDSLSAITCRAVVDDGAIVYLNGEEVFRVNLPTGPVEYETQASRLGDERSFLTFEIPVHLLREGNNLLAAEIHQISGTSSDIRWQLEMKGVSTLGKVDLVDEVYFDQQYPDVSYGRDPLQPGRWGYYAEPTPGASNGPDQVETLAPSAPVLVSHASGYYEVPFQVVLSSAVSGDIHYTLDGSVPGSQSPLYQGAIEVTDATILRVRSLEIGKLSGAVQTYSYLFGVSKHALPVVSLVVEPDVLFDSSIGIYRNIIKGREAPIHLDYFGEDRRLAFSVNAGAKIAGENIWRFAQKPLTISMRGKYGDDLVQYPLFDNERQALFGQFVFRNGGDNWPNAMLRDAMTPFMLEGQSHCDVQNYRPCVMYLNGEYWGIYNLRERLDEVWFQTHHHLNVGAYDYLEYAHVIGNAVALLPIEGDTDAYLELEQLAVSSDLTDPDAFHTVASQIDLDSLCDYIVFEDFVYNSSWRHNREFWRERTDEGKWHWVIPDLDRGFRRENVDRSLIDNIDDGYPLVGALLNNASFRNRLAQRYAAHLGSTFHPDRIRDILHQLDVPLAGDIEQHIARWRKDGGIQSLETRSSELDEILEFSRNRTPHARRGMSDYLGMGDTAIIQIKVVPPEAGRVTVCGVPALPDYNMAFELFRNVPAELEAQSAAGYRFVGWEETGSSEAEQSFVVDVARHWTALFERSDETMLPERLDELLVLDAAHSPYIVPRSLAVERGGQLIVEAGVEIRMAPQADLMVRGQLDIRGEAERPVLIHARNGITQWGSMVFEQAEGVQHVSHLILRNGGLGPDPVRHRGAISNMDSELVIDHLDLESSTTIFALGGRTTLIDSRIHSPHTGDGINVKRGWGNVEGCVFLGNTSADTDAIDFDGVVGGVIRGNRIYAFRGPNSDGIDVGEQCVDLLVEGNLIYNNSDKGISVGQGSLVNIRENLIVGCVLGVGIKDTGSEAHLIHNTFVDNETAVAVYEKNLLHGGGSAWVDSCIIVGSGTRPVTVDSLSTAETVYTLFDPVMFEGMGNFIADPGFVDPASYNFQLKSGSLALDRGNPLLGRDLDGTLPDLGAHYQFQESDYPHIPPHLIVINEIMAHSHDEEPDWIELLNQGTQPVDIGGWYLSDDEEQPRKFQIPDGTILEGGAFAVFYEDVHFGESVSHSGKRIAFALSENGETVSLFAPGDGLYLDYLEKETFGPSASGVSRGRYEKNGSGLVNFVPMTVPTPGKINSPPLVGPIVISEIMYHPESNAKAEYLELTNISPEPVAFWEEDAGEPWRFTDGIDMIFSIEAPLTMSPGERIILALDPDVFAAVYQVPDGTRVLPWNAGALSNGGEKLELSRPGDVDAQGERQYLRIDRVVYGDSGLWPDSADGGGFSLHKRNIYSYGNDASEWFAAGPNPGVSIQDFEGVLSAFEQWSEQWEVPLDASVYSLDPDQDGRNHFEEFAQQTNPWVSDEAPASIIRVTQQTILLRFPVSLILDARSWTIEYATDLLGADWQVWPSVRVLEGDQAWIQVEARIGAKTGFFTLKFNFPEDTQP